MVDTTQTLGDDGRLLGIGLRHEAQLAEKGRFFAEIGGNGFRPAAQIGITGDVPLPEKEGKLGIGGAATATLGHGAALSAFAHYKLDGDTFSLQTGLSGEFNKKSGFTASAGARVDLNTSGPVQPYASITVSNRGGAGIEAGACTDVTISGYHLGDVCAGVHRSSDGKVHPVIGLGKSFL